MKTLSPFEIARVEERRQGRGIAEIADEAREFAGGWMCFGGRGSWTNQAAGAGLSGPVSDAELDDFVAWYVERGVEPTIEVASMAHATLLDGLAARGFILREFENVLARELPPGEDLPAALPHGWPDGLEVVRVDPADAEQVEAYVEHSTVGFRPTDQPITNVLARSVRRTVAHARCDCFLALVDGAPVGGGAVETAGEAASLFGTSVHPDHRRRGIQAALITRRLETARDRGARVVCIHSQPGIPTERNAARLGFALAYAKAKLAMPGEDLEASP